MPCEWFDCKGNITRACGQPAARVLLGEKEEIHLCDFHRRLLRGALVRQWKYEIMKRRWLW